MKKYMIADLVKASYDEFKDERDLAIKEIMDKWDISHREAEYLYINYPNEADQRQVLDAAESLDIEIEDVEDDDVENLNLIWDLAGSRGKPHVEIKSSIGKVFIYLSLSYGLSALILFENGNPANYPISKSDLKEIINANSFGKYYSENMRNNESYSDVPGAWGCIGENSDKPKRLGNTDDFAKLPKDLQIYLTRYIS